MGSSDGAEVCELVGLFMLHKLDQKFNNKNNIGLYSDDGLAAFRNMGPRTADKTRKMFIETFAESELKITIESNLIVVNFLDITLNLHNGKYYPYRKPGNLPSYVNAQSDHPPSILKQLPKSINRRISDLSCDQVEFDKTAPLYNDALKLNGFTQPLSYIEPKQNNNNNIPRNILWFNPPFGRTVRTNVGKQFLSLIDKHFPTTHCTKYSTEGRSSIVVWQI